MHVGNMGEYIISRIAYISLYAPWAGSASVYGVPPRGFGDRLSDVLPAQSMHSP